MPDESLRTSVPMTADGQGTRRTTPNPSDDAVYAPLLTALPLLYRVVTTDLKVAVRSPKLDEVLPSDNLRCCEQLGVVHSDADCWSARTIQTRKSVVASRRLGRLYFDVVTVPALDENNNCIASVELFHDHTAVKRLEQAYSQQHDLLETINKAMIESNHNLENAQWELERNNERLEAANEKLRSLDRLKDEFISIVSHELKAPLTSIKGSVDLILNSKQESTSHNVRELLTICQRNTDRLHRLVIDLLDVARIESGALSFRVETFSAREWIDDALQSMKPLADQKDIALIPQVDANCFIEADRERLSQVLVNLLNNAIKFTDHGRITVSAEHDGAEIVCQVTDSGVGIPPDSLHVIFEKFSQIKNPLRRNNGGTGLGLTIARAIVQEHGGSIRAESVPGEGSTFTFRIPQPPRCKDESGSRSAD